MRIELASRYLPRLTSWHVRRILNWISPADLRGLEYIRLIDLEPEDPEASILPAFLRGFTHNGRYLKKDLAEPPRILLYTQDLYLGIPSILKWTQVATLRIAFTLAHEVGHHVIATRGYIHDPTERYKPWGAVADPFEENMANAYALDVLRKMYKRWDYRVGRWLTFLLSEFFYGKGIQYHLDGKYQRAASSHFYAYMLNSDNHGAGRAYREDMNKLVAESPHSLTPQFDTQRPKRSRRLVQSGKSR